MCAVEIPKCRKINIRDLFKTDGSRILYTVPVSCL